MSLGPASTEGDHPPTNPAIWVRFPSEADGYFFRAVAEKMCDTDLFESFSSVKSESAIYWKDSGLYILSLMQKGT